MRRGEHMFWIGFISGLCIGGLIGVCTMCLVTASKR